MGVWNALGHINQRMGRDRAVTAAPCSDEGDPSEGW